MKNYILFIVVFILVSCELVVDVDVPIESPRLTLNSWFTPDSVWMVKLSQSRYILDNAPFAPIENATVSILQDNNVIENLIHEGNGIYKAASSKPLIGNSYEITAESATHGTVRSQSYVPIPFTIQDIEVTIPDQNNNSNSEITITIKFYDEPGIKNYYQFQAMQEYGYKHHITGDSVFYQHSSYLYSPNPAFGEEEGSWHGVIFNDALFDGTDVTLQLKSNSSLPVNSKLILYCRALSEELYQYQVTSILQDNTSGDPLAQPVNVFNNIENGFGIFGGYTEKVFTYKRN